MTRLRSHRRVDLAAKNVVSREELLRGVQRRSLFLAILGAILALSVADVMSGVAGAAKEAMSRPLTLVERAEYIKADVAQRWRSEPQAEVFPDGVQYIGLERVQQYARRIGIAPEAPCDQVVDTLIAQPLMDQGCKVMLRATYVDQSAAFVITVGVAVLGDEDSGQAAYNGLPRSGVAGIRPVAFSGTVSALFGAVQRQRSGSVLAGPYVVLMTAGYTDGRTRESVPAEEILHSELWPTAQAIAGQIARQLAEPPPDIPKCTQGNSC